MVDDDLGLRSGDIEDFKWHPAVARRSLQPIPVSVNGGLTSRRGRPSDGRISARSSPPEAAAQPESSPMPDVPDKTDRS
ncbi:MAG: hypothetical protein ACREC2_09830, partial [Bradyrhizobium sp.]